MKKKTTDGHPFRVCERCQSNGCAVIHIYVGGDYVRVCMDCLREEEVERITKVGLD